MQADELENVKGDEEFQDVENGEELAREVQRLSDENAGLLDELEKVYSQFLQLKTETDVSYAQLRNRNETLEQKIQELQRAYSDLESARNQLIHSERLAAMGQLAASIVHELNNPLMVVIGYVDLFLGKETGIDDEGRSYIRIVRNQAETIANLIHEILSFSRKQTAPFGPIDFNTLITVLADFLGNILRNRVTAIRLRLAPDLPAGYGAAQQAQQVLTNILTNAADALSIRGQVTIETASASASEVLSTYYAEKVFCAMGEDYVKAQTTANDRFIRIRCRDEGDGISPESLAQIFNPFFTTKPAGQGTGLGLSICRTIVERHHGVLLVSSEPGQGTTFTVFWPAQREL